MKLAQCPFRQLNVIKRASRNGKKIYDCYPLMYQKKLWIYVYHHLYGKEKLMENDPQVMQSIDTIIEQLKSGTFRFSNQPENLVNIAANLIPEMIKIILQQIYTPIFSKHAYGYLQGKTREHALLQIKQKWQGVTWAIVGKITQTFHLNILLNNLAKKISDQRFLRFIHHTVKILLKNNAAKQASGLKKDNLNLSSILNDLYFHPFDDWLEKRITEFSGLHKNQQLHYVRFENTFIIGVNGSKQTAKNIKESISKFLEDELSFYLEKNSLQFTHLEKPILFLDYNLRKSDAKNSRRVYNNSGKTPIVLEIPRFKLCQFASRHKYGDFETMKATHRTGLLQKQETEILTIYNKELESFANYYKLANNFHTLNRLFYLAKSSFIKTIANKRKSTARKVVRSMKINNRQGTLCLIKNNKVYSFIRLKDVRKRANEFI